MVMEVSSTLVNRYFLDGEDDLSKRSWRKMLWNEGR